MIKTFNDIFVKRLLEDFINHVEEEEHTGNVKILKQLNFQREVLLAKEMDSTEAEEIFRPFTDIEKTLRIGMVYGLQTKKLTITLVVCFSHV